MNKHSLLDRLCVCTFVAEKKNCYTNTHTQWRKVLQLQCICAPCTGTTVYLLIHYGLSKSNMCWYKYVENVVTCN